MKDDNCIFCRLACGDIPAQTVYEDSDFRVIPDAAPASEGHLLIIPKEHAKDLCGLSKEVSEKVLPLAARLGKAVIKGLACDGFNVVINTGEAAGQTVMHFHAHIIPRRISDEAVLQWKPGEAPPEKAREIAEKIKSAL